MQRIAIITVLLSTITVLSAITVAEIRGVPRSSINSDNSSVFCNPFTEFKCYNDSKCISKYLACDGKKDCEDDSDEQTCNVANCPERPLIVCRHALHKCFSDAECDNPKICCHENCGNTCRDPVYYPTNGRRVVPRYPKNKDVSSSLEPVGLTESPKNISEN
ncbi:Low-density lipoprotein receptor-related protein like [Argiope bruennichi]|uniref:Low-density lipoprotein receptor-related protein like n=1 Tax=Argiope bruennichi TaxID=94029 RepID=A0A8T0EGI7_ARGBR|nr:Low-density lipoprotein receptor-related protein like [Argiope bruennichi]